MMTHLTKEEMWAVGAACCITACTQTDITGHDNDNVQIMQRMTETSMALIHGSGITGTELKDLGLRLIREANTR
jgi:hypothetical protein